MQFKISTALVALAAAVMASAVAVKRDDAATCTLVLTPDAPVDVDASEFNFVIGRALSVETGSGIDQHGSSFTKNADGTYTVVDTISADGLTAAQTAADIEGWVGQTEPGIAANWLVDSVTCAYSIHKPSKPSNLNMQFKLSAVFVALAAAVAVSAVAVKRDDAATCTLVFTPSAAVDPSTDLDSEFNFVIGRALSAETGGNIEQFGSTATKNADGTYTVVDTIAADGLTAAQTAADIEGWVGQTEQFGFSSTPNADGSYTVVDTISSAGLTAMQNAAYIGGWVGQTKPDNATNRIVDSASCA
ncbi:hypothetical protein CVT26_012681 [Gymnopilus dilepis]|uniref:PLAT domain-containing protein n=1 Tax=Gymnopilus dilepis TaxID=231916 RepID=A0A409WAR2_9AGAR|nr:hypothetical protein CVT26_012681 [Gymnopilus dilepis]